MDRASTRWFDLARSDLKALLWSAVILLLALAGLDAWRRVVRTEEFRVDNAPDALPVPLRIDINTAPSHELQFLPGIGEALAEDIVRHRQRHGPFERLDDLRAIRGIGAGTVERIRPHAICGR